MQKDSSRWLDPGDPVDIAAQLRARFAAQFGRAAHGVWFAPGRANLNGEHIDFHGGRCLPMALQHGTYLAAAPRTDARLRLRTLEPDLDTGVVEIAADSSAQQPDGGPDWVDYVWGVLWSMQQPASTHPELAVGPSFGADILIGSTLPIGAGLSSSAALECSAALAFTALGTPLGASNPGRQLNAALTDDHRAALAQACIRAEVEAVGAGTGGLDQNTSLRAGAGELLCLDCRDYSIIGTDMSPLLAEHQLIAIDTGQPHALVSSAFGDRRAESEAAAAVLGVERLRDALPEHPTQHDVDHALATFDAVAPVSNPAASRRRLAHALTEMLRSEQLHTRITQDHDDAAATAKSIGQLMTAGHASMRDNAEVSFALADQIVDTVLDHGALGARLIGGGFGGSVLVLLHRNDQHTIADAATSLSPGVHLLAVEPSAAARVM